MIFYEDGRRCARLSTSKNKLLILCLIDSRQTSKLLPTNISDASFKRGLCIDVLLPELIDVNPRNRRRKEAYNSLIKYPKDEQNITITIKTKKQ